MNPGIWGESLSVSKRPSYEVHTPGVLKSMYAPGQGTTLLLLGQLLPCLEMHCGILYVMLPPLICVSAIVLPGIVSFKKPVFRIWDYVT